MKKVGEILSNVLLWIVVVSVDLWELSVEFSKMMMWVPPPPRHEHGHGNLGGDAGGGGGEG